MTLLTDVQDVQHATGTRAGRRTSRPVALLTAAILVAALIGPLVFLLIEAAGAGGKPAS